MTNESKTTLETKLIPFEEVPEGMGAISVMDQHGDTKHIWNPKNEDEVEAARLLFDNLLTKGFRAFKLTRVNRRGAVLEEFDPKAGRVTYIAPRKKAEYDGEIMTKFDPKAENIQMVPQLQGG